MRRPTLQIIAAVIGFLTALAAFNFLRKFDWGSTGHYKKVGQILAVEGQVERRLPGAVNMETVPNPRPLFHQDLIVIQNGGSATISLEPNGPTLRLHENTRFIPELDATKPGAFIGTLLDGTLTVLNPGRKDLFRLFREGKEVAFEAADKTLVPMIPADGTALPARPSDSAGGGITIVATQPDESSAAKPEATPVPSAALETPASETETDVLTNDDIIKTLRTQTGLFQRCFLSFIHRNSVPAGTSGRVTMSFTVQSSGRVVDAQVKRSDFKDETLHHCIKEVTERTRFKTFRGAAVPVQEFPISLQ